MFWRCIEYWNRERIVRSLERLNARAIPRVRGKAVYKALLEHLSSRGQDNVLGKELGEE